MASPLCVAAVQLAAHDRTALPAAWEKAKSGIVEAADAGAQLVVLPEATLPAYVLGYGRLPAEEVSAQLEECSALARERRVVVVLGAARVEGDRVYNSALVFDADGSLAGYADKHFLWHFDRQWFAPGEVLRPVPTSVGTLGVLVCADGRIPTIAASLVDRGAQVLVMPTAWVTSGRDPLRLENVQADLLARVRAKENCVPFVAANKCGVERQSVAYCGKSQIVRADGTIAAIAPEGAAQTLIERVEIGRGAARSPAQTTGAAVKSFERPARVAVAYEPPDDAEELMRILEADVLLHRGGTLGDPDLAPPVVHDAEAFDPRALAVLRLRGATFVQWNADSDPQWTETIARARALELKMYVAVIDSNARRAFAADPDGTIVCGTFDGYKVATFACDPRKCENTLVAPGTDVLRGLERAATHAAL
jgi:predicted amidohydrolase